ncbi:predicted protein [Histoplasma capsulatum H143]|uniref:Uncharacterized protein n=1 Tax=Ajellomyces capsulatus (strain H143) TaxID=544712 RepID=C6HCS4_AJECH|nr:predicted protein [Histoplasma capsulatum H143]
MPPPGPKRELGRVNENTFMRMMMENMKRQDESMKKQTQIDGKTSKSLGLCLHTYYLTVLKFTPTIRFAQKAYLVVVGLVRDKAATEEEAAAEQPGRNIRIIHAGLTDYGSPEGCSFCKRAADLLSQKGEAMKEVITLTSGAAGQILDFTACYEVATRLR